MTKSFKPMLAATLKGAVPYPVWVSPKIDGVRAVVRNGVVLSRSLKPIPNKHVQDLFRDLEGLDGELVLGCPFDPGLMQNTISAVMTVEGTPDVRFHYFDCFSDHQLSFSARLKKSRKIGSGNDKAIAVLQLLIYSEDDLMKLEEAYLSQGYEGLILRSPEVGYKFGRSTLKEFGLVKFKRFVDDEATIVACHELMTNNNTPEEDELGHAKRSTKKAGLSGADTLGSFEVRSKKWSKTFSVGSGLTEEQRNQFWIEKESLIGKLIKFKYFGQSGMKDVPRFPTFIGFRHEEDL